jgi:alkanesulfonate monooxygenase SsuD/methylene tetrahydromethanopterin reductase-like flavin-dependent oxidoreductase (luciferase family)
MNFMRYGFVIPTGDPQTVADLAREAEAAGWDGVFTWDGIYVGDSVPVFDPWVVMAGMAMVTERVRIGAVLSPLSRRRPWKVARESVTLDHLSKGRLILPVGLGAVETFGQVGEVTDRRIRAELLDESLAILNGPWSGEPFSFEGTHYHLGEMTFLPRPVQQPRIPIWVAGRWGRERSMWRVIACDGVLMEGLAVEEIPEMIDFVEHHRTLHTPFDVVAQGETPGDNPAEAAATIGPLAEAGVTWWLETRWNTPNTPDVVGARIRQGPPRV